MSIKSIAAVCMAGLLFYGCGNNQEPAESPSVEPAAAASEPSAPTMDPEPSSPEQGASEGGGEGTHTMPDGGVMSGHHHGDHSE